MPPDQITRLSEPDQALLTRAFVEGVEGSYLPEEEVHTVTGFSRQELREVAGSWPEATFTTEWEPDPVKVQYLAVKAILNNLAGYPHARWSTLGPILGADAADLRDLLARWAD